MQNPFGKHKRKHTQEGNLPEERSSKHTKHSKQSSFTATSSSKSVDRLSQDFRPSLDLSSQSSKPSKSQKVANLIRALDDALEEDGMDEVLDLVGDETLNRCLDLRTSLSKYKSKLDASALLSPTPSQQQTQSKPRRSHDDFWNLPKTMSPFSLTPWKSSTIPLSLPPLPEVLDPTLEAAAFIHIGCTTGNPKDLNYERLEWVGDAYLYLISTLLISQTFPLLSPGKCSQMRERLNKNLTLSQYSQQYHFDKRAKLPDYLALDHTNINDCTKIMGDIFEAYVAAVVLSDPADGVRRVSEWLKDVWGMTIAKDILNEERNGMWVDSPLWRLRGKTEPVQVLAAPGSDGMSAKDKLAKTLGAKGVLISYKDAAPEERQNKMPLFTVGVYLSGYGEQNKLLASAKAMGKKEAGNKAAELVLSNKKVMKMYLDRKALHDKQLEMEKAALEKHDGA